MNNHSAFHQPILFKHSEISSTLHLYLNRRCSSPSLLLLTGTVTVSNLTGKQYNVKPNSTIYFTGGAILPICAFPVNGMLN